MPRPRTPTAIRRLRAVGGRDSVSHRPISDDEPSSAPIRNAQPPAWLTVAARKEWTLLARELERMGVLTQADMESLGMLCEAHASLKAQLRLGRFSAELWRAAQAMYGRFGLTPADRARLSVKKPDESELGAFLAKG